MPKFTAMDGCEAVDPGTVAALCGAPARVVGRGHLWAVAVRPGRTSDFLHRMDPEDHLRIVRLRLERLTREEAAGLAAELLGARLSPDLAALVGCAGGNPLLVTELVRGLREEGGVKVLDGTAWLRSPALPLRLQIVVRGYLSSVSEDSRHALRVAAVLEAPLRPAQLSVLAGHLRRSTAMLMPLLVEAVEAGLLLDREGALDFPSVLLRRAVAETVPWAVRQALLREARQQRLAAADESVRCVTPPAGDGHAVRAEAPPVDRAVASGLRAAYAGGRPALPDGPAAEVSENSQARGEELTLREREVLRCAAKAMSNRQIGRQLSITEGTVKRHMRNIFRKLDASSRMDAVNKAGSQIPAEPCFRS
ncbi:LuxR C-terminal-related transcriptional regulator [Streptomyces sp. NPDC056796]|uniref:helix-turn-helix transcriptional regulator n=1 Tax=Streptomyces sp. NPDC056796 TaxID=3345947 RepID=UPI0036CF055B